MHRVGAVLRAAHVDLGMREVDMVPAQIDQLLRAQAVAIRDQDHSRVAMTMPIVPGRLDELLDLVGRQVLARPKFNIALAAWCFSHCP